VLAHRPDEFPPFFAYHDALMERPGNLAKAEREMIVVATSTSNQCQYCLIAHGAILRIRAKNPLISKAMGLQHIEIRFARVSAEPETLSAKSSIFFWRSVMSAFR